MRTPIRSGFAYLWLIATVAVVAALAAFTAPYIDRTIDVIQVGEAADALKSLAVGVDSFNIIVKRGGPSRTTPHLLSQLTTTPVANGGPAGCTTQTYNSTAAGLWPTAAPYTSVYVPVGGLWTPLGKVNDAPSSTYLTEATARTSTSDPYYIQIPSVEIGLARMLDLMVDGAADSTAGTVRYLPAASDSTTLVSYLTTPTLPAC